MNIQHYWNYFTKRAFRKTSTWVILALHLLFCLVWIFSVSPLKTTTTISNINDFFSYVFSLQMITPFMLWTQIAVPISWFFWWRIDDVAQKTQTDGTDLFFLSTEIPTNRKKIFRNKILFLSCFLTIWYLLFAALPVTAFFWRLGWFKNLTGIQTFSLTILNFLIVPLLFFLPLIVFLFSLASLGSVWYDILKWVISLFGLSVLFLVPILGGLLEVAGGEKIIELIIKFSGWLSNNYALITLLSVGVVIFLALLTLPLAYEDFQEKDLS